MISFAFFISILNFSNIMAPQAFDRTHDKGSVYVAVYDSETTFLHPTKMRDKKILKVDNPEYVSISLAHLPAGTYAVSCFHDTNGNGKLDTNFFGVPLEPYGFSNNARPGYRAPTWDEAKVNHPNSGSVINIKLLKW